MNALTAGFGDEDLRRAILRSNQDLIPRNIALRVRLSLNGAETYLQRLYREIELVSPLLARDRPVVRLRFEGDDPATLGPAHKADLLESLTQHFALTPDAIAHSAQWPSDCDELGLGLGSVSRFGSTMAMNAAELADYCSALDAGRLPVIAGRRAAPAD